MTIRGHKGHKGADEHKSEADDHKSEADDHESEADDHESEADDHELLFGSKEWALAASLPARVGNFI